MFVLSPLREFSFIFRCEVCSAAGRHIQKLEILPRLHFERAKSAGPSRILSLESVDYFRASEFFRENFDGKAINWPGVVNFHCMQISLVMNLRFIKYRAKL